MTRKASVVNVTRNTPPYCHMVERVGLSGRNFFSQTSQGYVRNELPLPKLHRSDLLVTYSCQATNTNLTVPVSASVTIDINRKYIIN
ncbi:nephrin [Caerostris extrusa]|uniref:Nephrin n=1 Tax=Caerostris extrusa TaxID=172846 RepID=A0AAV4VH87_CAEEX|nr:nephrin [Caerostris extrusa]